MQLGGFIQDRRLRADVLFIRAQSMIRADGTPSAQAQSPQLDVSARVQCTQTSHFSRNITFTYAKIFS